MAPYVGEIRMFGGSFAPDGWFVCDGQLLPISEYEVLFDLIGTRYGGDGQETFGLPDLQGRVPVHQGQGAGLTQNNAIGDSFGLESVTLTATQLPNHTHGFVVSTAGGTASSPAGNVLASPPSISMFVRGTPSSGLGPWVQPMGGSQAHDNMPPVLAISYIISAFGMYPSPS